MTTLTTTATQAPTPTKFFTIAHLSDAVRAQLATWEPELHDILPGIVALPRLAADPDLEVIDDLVRWLGTTGATVAGPFPTFASAAFASRALEVA